MAEILKPFGEFETPGPCESVVSVLQGLVDEAKRGEIIGVPFAFVRPNNVIGYGHKPGKGSSTLLVAAAALQAQLLMTDLQNQKDDAPMPGGA